MINNKINIFLLILISVCSILTVYTIVKTVKTDSSYATPPNKTVTKTHVITNAKNCSSLPKINGLSSAIDTHLKKLDEYQTVCNSSAANRIMIFTDMPNSDTTASDSAISMANLLKEFSAYKITPIVIVEPSTSWGLTDFMEFESGFYDHWISTYFNTLQQEGISDAQMGTWVPFPEANAPLWNKGTAQPKDFAIDVNKYLSIVKSVFPNAKGSILLNGASYANDDTDWANGKYVSLLPYVSDINPDLVSSFGLQGFPWEPQNGSKAKPLNNAAKFIDSDLATEAADKMKVKDIWFNTGTFAGKYMQDPNKVITISNIKRQNILSNVLLQAQKTKEKGYSVWVNIFAEDKSGTPEQTDWSYWHDLTKLNTQEQQVLKNFIAELNYAGIGVSLYDNYKNSQQDIQ